MKLLADEAHTLLNELWIIEKDECLIQSQGGNYALQINAVNFNQKVNYFLVKLKISAP